MTLPTSPTMLLQTFFIKILSSSLYTVLIVEKHCGDVCSDEFPVLQIDRKSKLCIEQVCTCEHFALCCRSNATRAPIANPPNSAQLGGIPYHSPSYIWVRAIVWACSRGQTDTQTRVTNCGHARLITFRVVYNSREM